jgi:hypothetical protein
MKDLLIATLLSVAFLGCPPPPQEPVPEPTTDPVPPVPVDAVTGALSGHEGAFTLAGEMMVDPAQPAVAFAGTIHQWFGDDGIFYMVYDQPASETSGPAMQGWGKMWADEAGAAHMSWMESATPGEEMLFTGTVAPDGTITLDASGPGRDGTPTNYRATYRLPDGGADEFEMGVVLPDGNYMLFMKYTTTRTGDAVKTWEPPAAPVETPDETTTEPTAATTAATTAS